MRFRATPWCSSADESFAVSVELAGKFERNRVRKLLVPFKKKWSLETQFQRERLSSLWLAYTESFKKMRLKAPGVFASEYE